MASALRLRRSLTLTSAIINHQTHLATVAPCAAFSPSPHTSHRNPNPNPSLFHFKANISFSFKTFSTRSGFSNDKWNDRDDEPINADTVLFEGCDYNHWLITMDFPYSEPEPEEMVEIYVQTAAKVLGSVEEAKKKIYACSTTTYRGFQVEVSEEVSEQFKSLPGVVFVLPDSYIDPVNKEYGGDKYILGTIIPRPPPVQYGRQGGRFSDRNREYNRPPRGQMEQNNSFGGQGNYQGDRRGPMPSYQSNNIQGQGRNAIPARPTDFPQRDQGSNFTPLPGGDYSQGGAGRGGQYGQGADGQYGQTGGGQYGQGGGGQFSQGGGVQYQQGGGGQYGQGDRGQYGQVSGGSHGQGMGSGYNQTPSEYGEPLKFSQGSYTSNQMRDESDAGVEAFKDR